MTIPIRGLGAATVLLLTGLFIPGCGPEGEQEPGAPPQSEHAQPPQSEYPARPPLPGRTPRERCETLFTQGLAVEARTRPGLRQELGEPLAASHSTEPNRHMPARLDTLWAIRYEGLEARIRTAGGNDLLERVSVTDDRHLTFAEPAIGAPWGRITELLGPPDEEGEGDAHFLCSPEPMPDMPITFVLEEGRLAAILWHYYVD